MDTISPTPRNAILGAIADALRAGKEKTGVVGDVLLGDSDKFVDDLSYGQGPFKGAGGIGGTTGLKNTGIVDTALLPGAGALAAALRKAPQAAAKVVETAPDLSRRAFTGGGAAAAALAAVSPAALVKALKEVPAVAAKEAPVVAARVASMISPAGIMTLAKNSLNAGRQFMGPEGFDKELAPLVKAVADHYPKADEKMLDQVLSSHLYSGGDALPAELQKAVDAAGGNLAYLEKVLKGEVPRPGDKELADLASSPLVYEIGDVDKYPKVFRDWMNKINEAYQ